MHVFISYSTLDLAELNLIRFPLVGEFPLWIDYTRVKGGEPLSETIEEALRDAGVLLIIWSKNAASSKWVRREIQFFDSLSDEYTSSRVIIPIKLDKTELPLECCKPHYYLAEQGVLSQSDLVKLSEVLKDHPLLSPV